MYVLRVVPHLVGDILCSILWVRVVFLVLCYKSRIVFIVHNNVQGTCATLQIYTYLYVRQYNGLQALNCHFSRQHLMFLPTSLILI